MTNFTVLERGKIFAEVLTKFRKVFDVPTGKLTLLQDGEDELEQLKEDFWYQIVEAGWTPKTLLKKVGESYEPTDEIINMLEAAQNWAASVIGLPLEVLEL